MLSTSDNIFGKPDWYYKMQQDIEDRLKDKDQFFAFTRGLTEKPFGEAHKYDYLVEYIVDEITGPYDQDISVLLVGNKGRGKSLCGISLCYYSACELAERLGGKWTDYFNPDTNLAVILEEEANKLMAIQTKYQCKDYDDIGIGWGARNWQTDANKDKNDVFQINRTDSTLQVFSVPNQFLLDKVPRSLVSHYAEMAQQFFEHGFTTIKLFEPETLFREGKIIQPYMKDARTKYVLFRIPKPPKDLFEYYKKRRLENKIKATNKRMSDQPEERQHKIFIHPQTLEMEKKMLDNADVIRPLWQGECTIKEFSGALKGRISKYTADRWFKNNASTLDRLFPKSS